MLYAIEQEKEGDHLDPHDQSPGAASLQGHPDPEKNSAGRVRGRAHERAAELSLSAPTASARCSRRASSSPPRKQAELARLADWARTTKDGSLSDLPVEPDPKVWTQVCSEAHICTTKTCGQNPNCFFQQARKRLLAADVIVINHTLLFMLLGSAEEQEERESGYLFPNDFIIFDEAHTLEQVASRQIGIGVSQYGLRATIQRLYNARTEKGLFTVTRDAAGVTLAASLVDEIDGFFARSTNAAIFRKGREFRVREAGFRRRTRLPARLIALAGAHRRGGEADRGRISQGGVAGAGAAHSRRARRDRRPSSNRAPKGTSTGSSGPERPRNSSR